MVFYPPNSELKARARELYQDLRNVIHVANQINVPSSTVRRWVEDLVEQKRQQDKKHYEDRQRLVVKMRKQVRETGKRNLNYWAEKLDMSTSMVIRAIRGITFSEVNHLEAPVQFFVQNSEQRDKVRELYLSGLSFREIHAQLNISKSSISAWCKDLVPMHRKSRADSKEREEQRAEVRRLFKDEGKSAYGAARIVGVAHSAAAKWCKDLIAERRAFEATLPKSKRRRPERVDRTKRRGLTAENVVMIRRTMREQGVWNLRHHAEKHNVHIASVVAAAKGETFKHVDHIEPPITEQMRRYEGRSPPVNKINEALIEEIMVMRRQDPARWTYGELALWLNEKEGKTYRGNHIAVMILNRDPSLKELEGVKPERKPRIKVAKLSEAEKNKRLKIMRERRRREEEEIRRMIAEEDAREEALRIKALAAEVLKERELTDA